MRELFLVIISLAAIMAGLFGLMTLVGRDIALFIGLTSLCFGITSLMFTMRARSVLSRGSSLRDYTTSFALCLVLILVFSLWDTMIDLFNWSGGWLYPKYIFITLAYFVFLYTSYRIFNLGKEFGFKDQAEKIRKAMK
ncbi:MAG: hypothetical protein AABW87_03675 [Nanoarchaeota archaeon]